MAGSDYIKKGTDTGKLIFGAVLAAAGAVFIGLAVFGDSALRLGGASLPPWLMYVVAGVLIIAGCMLIKAARRVWKCAKCGTPLQYGEAFFPADRESDILRAVETLDASVLKDVPAFTKGSEWIVFSLDLCDKCGNVGVISAVRCNAEREKYKLISPVIISNETVVAFLPFVKPAPRTDHLILD